MEKLVAKVIYSLPVYMYSEVGFHEGEVIDMGDPKYTMGPEHIMPEYSPVITNLELVNGCLPEAYKPGNIDEAHLYFSVMDILTVLARTLKEHPRTVAYPISKTSRYQRGWAKYTGMEGLDLLVYDKGTKRQELLLETKHIAYSELGYKLRAGSLRPLCITTSSYREQDSEVRNSFPISRIFFRVYTENPHAILDCSVLLNDPNAFGRTYEFFSLTEVIQRVCWRFSNSEGAGRVDLHKRLNGLGRVLKYKGIGSMQQQSNFLGWFENQLLSLLYTSSES